LFTIAKNFGKKKTATSNRRGTGEEVPPRSGEEAARNKTPKKKKATDTMPAALMRKYILSKNILSYRGACVNGN
jgi:hypothetical protein